MVCIVCVVCVVFVVRVVCVVCVVYMLSVCVCACFTKGCSVVINFFDDGEEGHNRARAEGIVASLGSRSIAIAADVRSLSEMDRAAELTIERFGSLDTLVNNAGILRDRTLKKMSESEWQAVIDTNLTGVFNSCKAVVEKISAGGRIVNIASLAAATPTARRVACAGGQARVGARPQVQGGAGEPDPPLPGRARPRHRGARPRADLRLVSGGSRPVSPVDLR